MAVAGEAQTLDERRADDPGNDRAALALGDRRNRVRDVRGEDYDRPAPANRRLQGRVANFATVGVLETKLAARVVAGIRKYADHGQLAAQPLPLDRCLVAERLVELVLVPVILAADAVLAVLHALGQGYPVVPGFAICEGGEVDEEPRDPMRRVPERNPGLADAVIVEVLAIVGPKCRLRERQLGPLPHEEVAQLHRQRRLEQPVYSVATHRPMCPW